ncbi:carbohydrate ABC transporter permease [Pseudonocardia nigra]|uniref:carbohydrate ABC transporter permease n=1 Tax=Pseudonocardia nigra TaxID=1921578 RepID=UPI001C5F7B10|nr:sugar ABC transporter permease [Pseudonocardia nigra]
MIAPTGLGLLVFYLWPIVRTLYLSFTESGAFGSYEWTGVENYAALVTDPVVAEALLNTFLYSALVLLGIPVSVVVASLLNTKGLRGVGIYRTLFFLPVVTMPVAVAIVWQWIYNGSFGILNFLLGLVGIDGTSWLTNPRTALVAIGLVGIWMTLGYNVVILLAGLQGIPQHYYEAAEIDGAGPVRQFFSVTVPLLSPSIFFVTVLTMIQALQVFDLVFVMIEPTNPALPNVRSVVYLFYQEAFVNHDRGYAAAIVMALLVVILLMTLVQFRLQRKWVHYE